MKIFSLLIRLINGIEVWVIPVASFLRYVTRYKHRAQSETSDLLQPEDKKVE